MAQFRSTISFDDADSYQRGVRIAREVLLYARERKALILASAGGGEAERVTRKALAAEDTDSLLLRIDTAGQGGTSLALVLRPTDLYVISLHNSFADFYFSDILERKRLNGTQVSLRFSSSYVDIGSYASLSGLSANALRAAVIGVANWRPGRDISTVTQTASGDTVQSPEMRQLLLLILATAEAFRLRPVEETVAQALGASGCTPRSLGEIDRLVRDWSKRSRAAMASGATDPDIAVSALP